MSLIPSTSPYQKPETVSVQQALKLMNDNKYQKAIGVCDRVLELMPENATAICVRAVSKWRLNENVADCVEELRGVLASAPDSPVAKRYLALVLVSTGAMDEAKRLLEDVLETEDEAGVAFFDYVEIEKFKEESPFIKNVYERYVADTLAKEKRTVYAYGLAKVYDDLKMPERAMELITEANASVKAEYDKSRYDQRLNDLKDLRRIGFENVKHSGKRTKPPIFIVGLPRSGTTLIETIFSRHPDIFAAGETMHVPQVEAKMRMILKKEREEKLGEHTWMLRATKDQMRDNAEYINAEIRKMADEPYKRYTDKLPGNASRLPLISALYPTAPIIFARRHPLDCCLSNLFKRFSNALDFSFAQHSLGEYYRHTMDHIEIGRHMIPNPVLDMSYDLLVADPEYQTRRMIKFAGLSWNDACLSPEDSNRKTVMTASKWQVRQPIYKTSSAKWKRYEPYLGEMIEAMGGMDWIEEHVRQTHEAGMSEV